LPILHRRASEWFERNDAPPEAIRHALAAQDFEHAATLIERALPATRQNRQEAMLLSWFRALPEDTFRHRPVLSAHFAGALLQSGQLEGVEARLGDAERWLGADDAARPNQADEEGLQRLPGLIAMYHAGIALIRGDVAATRQHAQQVMGLAREDDYFMRGAASSLLGLAAWTTGDLETAYQTYTRGMDYLRQAGYLSDVIGGFVSLADIRITQGRPREALDNYERGLQLAAQPGRPPLRGAADMHVGLSEIYRERNELDVAAQHLRQSQELGALNGLPKNPYRRRVAAAGLLAARGEINSALELLNEAEPLYEGDFSPNVRPVAAIRARLWIAAGRLGEALGWARARGVSAGDDLDYLREYEHITLARLLLARARNDDADGPLREALGLLERLRQAAEAGGRMGSAIEILILQALSRQLQGDTPAALAYLERALMLAEPEEYARIFLDEGAGMGYLIAEAAGRGIRPNYTGKLLAAFGAKSHSLAQDAPQPAPASASMPLEPLSQRELEILRLFRTELSGPEIAQELVIALSTVRTHTKSIYGKLNVNSRRAAVNRATELGLI
jgi:LuxR family maltose regulon positive regulatory protein